jgi:hypothetical protein
MRDLKVDAKRHGTAFFGSVKSASLVLAGCRKVSGDYVLGSSQEYGAGLVRQTSGRNRFQKVRNSLLDALRV